MKKSIFYRPADGQLFTAHEAALLGDVRVNAGAKELEALGLVRLVQTDPPECGPYQEVHEVQPEALTDGRFARAFEVRELYPEDVLTVVDGQEVVLTVAEQQAAHDERIAASEAVKSKLYDAMMAANAAMPAFVQVGNEKLNPLNSWSLTMVLSAALLKRKSVVIPTVDGFAEVEPWAALGVLLDANEAACMVGLKVMGNG